jgi:hypothetical protein
MKPDEILMEAANLVTGSRLETHGSAEESYGMVAELWGAYRGEKYSTDDVLVMMALMKIGRVKHGSKNIDDFVDACGYLGLAGALS